MVIKKESIIINQSTLQTYYSHYLISMEELARNPFLHSEYTTTLNKDVLAIYFWANNPNGLDANQRLTMVHLAAIIKHKKCLEDPEKYKDLIIDPKLLTTKALYLNAFIEELNICLGRLHTSALRVENNSGGRIGWILNVMKDNYPSINKNQIEEGYELGEFLELLKNGIYFENSYLTGLKIRFDMVPSDLKI